ncbi:hypothetical protein AK86_08950 [Streptococcus pneumoniae B1599]|nr:hypothetical protein AK86_08950 [Streptococcus pneumoniae B1599]
MLIQQQKPAKKAIDDATTNAKVDEAKTNGKQASNNINPQPAPRPNPTPNSTS